MPTQAESKIVNETLFNLLATPGMEKRALDSINDFTRFRVREEGITRRILPLLPLSNDELDRQVDTDKAVKVVDIEPDSPAAISVPLATLPMNYVITGPRYAVLFDRIFSRRFTKDIDELRTWHMDIRQVISDNAIKDMLAEEDSKFLMTVNTALVAKDAVTPTSGVPQWVSMSGGISRDTVLEAFKVMPRTPSHLEVHTVLINNVTIREIQKWGRDEVGGTFSEELLRNGFAETEFMNARWLVTIKRDLVPDDTIFMFADPKFIGKFYSLEDTTMYIKREAFMLEFYAYEYQGCSIGNTNSLARVDFE